MIKDALFHMGDDIEHIKRNAVIQIVIVTLAFIMLMRVFPQGVVQNHSYSRQKAFHTSARETLRGDAFTINDKKLQTVYFSREHLYAVKLYMVCSVPDKSNRSDFILFRLYDENFSCIYEEQCCCGDIEDNGYLTATPDMDVEPNKVYYYEILIPEDCGGVFELPVADRGQLEQTDRKSVV